MATTVLNRLLNNLKNTANPHKRKITAVAILAIVFALAWKKLKTHHVINGVMFFFRMSSRLVAILPTPIFASYRQVLPFSYQKQESMPNLIKAMNTSEIIAKIKVVLHLFRKTSPEQLKNSCYAPCQELYSIWWFIMPSPSSSLSKISTMLILIR